MDINPLEWLNGQDDQTLFHMADETRAKNVGNEVHLRGLIEFSNYCTKNCRYCGLRAQNGDLKRYRMEPDEIVETAKNASKLGYKTVVMQSGEDPTYTADKLAGIISKIKSTVDIAITLGVGERPKEDYALWKQAGADRFLLRHEAANRELYASLHPDGDYDNRIRCLYDLKELGYQVGAGCMIGVPGQTVEHLAEDLELFKKIDADMIGMGPFIPNPNTPLGNEKAGDLALTLRMVALARLIRPDAMIPATTALGTMDSLGRQKALKGGANVVMPNVTPRQYREMYEIYPNKICINDTPEHCRGCISGIIRGLGREVGTDYGHRPK